VLNAAALLPMAAGLTIFGTPPVGHGPEGFAGFKNLSPTAFTAAPTEAQIEEWVHTAFAPGYTAVPDFVVEDFRRTDGNARACLGAVAQAGGLADEVEIVRNLKIPLAILQGGEEQIVDLGYLQRLAAPTLWRGAVQVVDGAGHSTQWEQAGVFNELLDALASGV
jgi:pimeloyl-ACP methyl ester carboxylesterase